MIFHVMMMAICFILAVIRPIYPMPIDLALFSRCIWRVYRELLYVVILIWTRTNVYYSRFCHFLQH